MELGATWARWTPDPAYEAMHVAYCRQLRAVGIQVFLTLDGDAYRTFGELDDINVIAHANYTYAQAFGEFVSAVNPVNEPDGTGDESTHMTYETVNECIYQAQDKWPDHVPIVGVGSVSGDVGYYDGVRTDWLDGIDGHFYAKMPPSWNPSPDMSLERIIDEHLVRIGRPLWISEIGLPIMDGVDEELQADFLRDTMTYLRDRSDVAGALWFHQHYGGWGLMGADHRRRPAWYAFQDVAGGLVIPEVQPTYVLGFERWANLEGYLLGAPLRDERVVAPGWTTQATSTGVLNWVDGKGYAFATHDGRIFQWDGSDRPSVEMM